MSLTIGIIGCGSAGQAASILLARAGHRVHVFEQAPRVSAVGAGLLIQPTGMAVLRLLDVADDFMAIAAPIRRLQGTVPGGRTVLDLKYADLRPDLCGYGLQRSALCASLLGEMNKSGVGLRLGVAIENLESTDDSSTLIDADGARHGPFDLVIVADGARSRLRARHERLIRRDRPYSWGALWFIGDDPDRTYADVLRQAYRGTDAMIGFLPSGRASSRAIDQVSLFWSMRARDWGGAERFDLDAWKRRVRAITDAADPLLDQIRSPSQVLFAPYRDAILRQPFDGRVVFIGDAGHAMSPQLGQGVNLALLDAAELARQLAGGGPVHAALRRFARAMRRNVAFYQWASRWLTPVFQSDLNAVAIPRDALLGPMCRFGPARRQMLLSLCGVKTGLRSADPLPDAESLSGP